MDINARYSVDLVALHITNVCSHRCPFCYAAPKDNIKPVHPPIQQLETVVDALAAAYVKSITLLGGDPVSYPSVVELAEYICQHGITVSIMSNTLRFPNSSDEEAAKHISAFEATIHHYLPQKHDEFCRSTGAYNNVVNKLRRFSELGRKTGIAINVMPTTANIIYDIVEQIVVKYNVPLNYIVVQRIIPFGRASNSSEFTMMHQNVEEALTGINRVHEELGLEIMVEDPFPLCVIPERYKKYMQKCEWGYTKASVDASGNLSRCGADPRYRLGNILEQPLLEIWNNSDVLKSFRSKKYLPGRCQVCPDLESCGGGCPLSCEIEKDHSIDYLYSEFERLDEDTHGQLEFGAARYEELSSILQLEWSNFPGYGHMFSVDSIQQWYKHNPSIFHVVRDSSGRVLAYAAIVPIEKRLSERIIRGELSSITQFPSDQVFTDFDSDYWHIEVIARVPSRTASRVGSYLIKSTGHFLLNLAKHVTASPITIIGERLCSYFGFQRVSAEDFAGKKYPVFYLQVDKEKAVIENKLLRF